MSDPVLWHRLQFAFTIIYHYLFPQLTMGLALLIVVFKWLALRHRRLRWNDAARFWIRIFGINFAVGVVTGIPMEFQFGTNWARVLALRRRRHRPDARDGGDVRVLPRVELPRPARLRREAARAGAATSSPRVALFVGSWLSGYFIIVHQRVHAAPGRPRGRRRRRAAARRLLGVPAQPLGARAVRAQHGGRRRHRRRSWWPRSARYYALAAASTSSTRGDLLRVGVVAGLAASVLVAFPTGDRQAKLVARHQPVGAGRDGGPLRERAERRASPSSASRTSAERRLDNPIVVPGVLSFLAYGTFHADVHGLDDFPENTWPDNIELLYYAFHIMVGLGTLFIADDGRRPRCSLWRGSLDHEPADAVGPDARVSVPVHRDDRGLDDGGAGTPAVARLRPDADGGRRQPNRALGDVAVHAARLLRPLLRARACCSCS